MRVGFVLVLILLTGPVAAWEKVSESGDGTLYRGRLTMPELNRQSASTMAVTLPIGPDKLAAFEVAESNFVEGEWSGIRVFEGRSGDGLRLHLVVGKASFYGQVLGPDGVMYLDPAGEETVKVYNGSGVAHPDFKCLAEPGEMPPSSGMLQRQAGGQAIRTFRLAAACTAEFTQFHGSKDAALLSLTAALNRAHGIFEREMGVRFQLVPQVPNMIYEDPGTDPYRTNEPGYELLGDAQKAFDQVVGNANYDVGIVLTRGLYGLAYIRSVCDPERKGASCIGLPEPTGDAFHVNLVTHELGHQFGANHTFNSPTGFCLERRSEWTAFEPGTGSTIMSYSSLPCEGDSFVTRNDDYFHSESLKEMRDYLNIISCGQAEATGNNPPNVNAGPEFVIPARTPFALTAAGSDPDGDGVTFCWEQRDRGPAQTLAEVDNGSSPLFRSYRPSESPTRVFPAMHHILAGDQPAFEELPSTDRMLRFRVTARDSRNNGAWSFSDTQVRVVNTGAPFRVTSHGTGETLAGSTEVRWDVAGTTAAPINAQNVRITLSTDGGQTFPHVLAESTANDGAETVVVPNVASQNARIKVEAVGKSFFNVNAAVLRVGTAGSELRITSVERSQEGMNFSFQSESGKTYRVEKANTFPDADWVEAQRITAQGPSTTVTLGTPGSAGYIRIVQE